MKRGYILLLMLVFFYTSINLIFSQEFYSNKLDLMSYVEFNRDSCLKGMGLLDCDPGISMDTCHDPKNKKYQCWAVMPGGSRCCRKRVFQETMSCLINLARSNGISEEVYPDKYGWIEALVGGGGICCEGGGTALDQYKKGANECCPGNIDSKGAKGNFMANYPNDPFNNDKNFDGAVDSICCRANDPITGEIIAKSGEGNSCCTGINPDSEKFETIPFDAKTHCCSQIGYGRVRISSLDKKGKCPSGCFFTDDCPDNLFCCQRYGECVNPGSYATNPGTACCRTESGIRLYESGNGPNNWMCCPAHTIINGQPVSELVQNRNYFLCPDSIEVA